MQRWGALARRFAAFSVDVLNIQDHSLQTFKCLASTPSTVYTAQNSTISTYTQFQRSQFLYQLEQWRPFSRQRAAVQRLSRASQRANQPTLRSPSEIHPTESKPTVSEVADVVGHSALIVTRPIEWGTVLLGFEQANRYTVYNASGQIVAHLLEEEGSLGRALGRQFLKTRRSFQATVLSPSGDQIIFRLRRPAYLISSTMYIETGDGERIGEVQQRWHPWRRRYDLFLGTTQFATIDGGFLAWEFELKDRQGDTLALIDRNFSGFGKEIFTDAGQYVVHFGTSSTHAAEQIQKQIAAAHTDHAPPSVTSLAKIRTGVSVIPTTTGNQLAVARPLRIDERMIALACAISVDYDFFSRHSYGGGMLSPFVHPPIIPFPMPMGGVESGAEGGVGEGGSMDTSTTAAPSPHPSTNGQDTPPAGPDDGGSPLERDLGGDEFGWNARHQSPNNTKDNNNGGDLDDREFWGAGDDDDDDEGGSGFSDFMGSVFGWGEEE